MIFKKKRNGVVASVLAFLALSFGFVGYKMVSASSEAKWSAIEIEETYSVGDTVIVPDAKIEVNGQSYDTTCTIIFPNGTAQKSNTFVAKESGEYQLVYKAVINGKAVEKTVEFLVNNTLYSVGNELSSASYGTNSYLPEDVNGINLSLAPNDTFKFNKIIDLSEATKNDNIIKFYLTPKAVGEPDAAQIKIRLTDIYNPDNYVTMTYKTKILSEVNYGTIYRTVGASNQPQVGLHYQANPGDNTADTTYIQYGTHWFSAGRNPIYGAGVNISSDGNPRNREFIDNYEYFAMDYASKQVFAHPHWFTFEPYNLIADLDDYRMVGDSLWNGFTTGECLLSIEGTNYITSSLNMFITEVAGYDLTDFNFKDDRAPALTLDFGEYDKNFLPYAVVNKPYTLFGATGYDNLDGEIQPTVTVYYNYYSDMRTLVNVQNGAFTPKRAGVYTVIYTAQDSVGNVSSTSYDITACVPESPLTITSSPVSGAVAASTVKLGNYTVENSNGKYEVKITATLKSNPEVIYEVDKAQLSFMPLYAGVYEVKYLVKDYVSTEQYSYDLTVAAPSAPQIVNEPVLPKYLIKGASYVFDSVNAYSYSGAERTEVPTTIYVAEDDAAELTAIGENSYTVSANSSVTLVYKATENGQESQKSYTIPVVDTNYGNEITYMDRYFQGTSFTSKDGEKGIVYTNENAKGDVTLSYIRDALLYGFKFDFDFVDGYENFEKLAFTLTEVGNADNVLKITVQKTPTAYICALQDGREYEIAYSSNLTTVTVSYSPAKNAVTFNGSIEVSASDFGFNGFNNNYVTFDTTFVKASGKVGIEFSRLYMQPLTCVSADSIAPQFYEMKKDSTRCSLNTVFTIYAPSVFDVIDPNVKVILTVLDPDGGHVTAKDGTLLKSVDALKDYQIDLNEYGAWTVIYLVVDHRGNSVEPSYVIHVKDYIAPTVEIGKVKTSYKVGEKFKPADVTLSDNYSKATKLSKSVLILSPDSVMEVYDEAQGYTLKKAGEYTVYYYVTDEAGNLTIASYKIKV